MFMKQTQFQDALNTLGLTRGDLADILDKSWKTVDNWWHGRRPVDTDVAILLTLWLNPAIPDDLRPKRGIPYRLPINGVPGGYYRRNPRRSE